MMKRLGVIVLWVLASIGTASLTYAAVTQAGRAVGEDPSTPVAGADIAARLATTTAPTTPEVATTAPVAPDDTTAAATSTTRPPSITTTTAAPTTTSGPTTTAPAVTAPSVVWHTVPGVGVVGVSVSGDQVTLVSATPVAPYHAEVDDTGPEHVDVKFESESAEYRVRAEVRDGELTWSVEQED